MRKVLQLAVMAAFSIFAIIDPHYILLFVFACFAFPILPIFLMILFEAPCSYGRLPRRK